MTENHQPDMFPFDPIKQFNRTGADRCGVRIATIVRLVTGKALAEGILSIIAGALGDRPAKVW